MRQHRTGVLLFAAVFLSLVTVTASAQDVQPQATEEVGLQAPVSATTAPTAAQGVTTNLVTPSPALPAQGTTYVIQRGDNLFRIALRFGTTVQAIAQLNGIVNPSLIYAGTTIRIPGGAAQPATPTRVPLPTATAGTVTASPVPLPTATPVSGATTTYVVQRGDTLARIALRNNTTVANLVTLNNIVNPNLIYVGQRLIVPGAGQGGGPVSTQEVAPSTAVPTAETITQGFGFDYGVEVSLIGQDTALAQQIGSLGMNWVKHEIRWSAFEATEGQLDFSALDTVVEALEGQGLSILLTVTGTPDWARTSQEENGPPDDFADFGRFISALAGRYAGRVHAYEVWSEPNLRREWNSSTHTISATSYIELLRQGFNAIKAADPAAVVVSAGLAPTGFNDGVNAINDRLFLQALYAGGLAGLSDAVGAHPGGWANPPEATCCNAPIGVTTHFEDPSFYLLDTLNAYRSVMMNANDGNTAIWVTKFGWGTSEDTDPPSQTYVFVTYTSLEEQALYIPRAYELGAELGFIGPMFLYDLNGCAPSAYVNTEACYYSLIGPDGAPRPALAAVQAIDKDAGAAGPAATPTATEIVAPTFTPPSDAAAPEASPTEAVVAPATATEAQPTDVPPTEAPPASDPAATEETSP
jgi:LysM repeat protein